jgi:hypothetical protein
MTKTILLQGGPKDGEVCEVASDLDCYTVLREIAPGKKIVLLGFERGYYVPDGSKVNSRHVFRWKGWEGERN